MAESPGTRMRKECEQQLRGLVTENETILAVGTAEELSSLGSEIGSGGGFTFIVVTSERVLFAYWGASSNLHEEIRLDQVTHWASGTQYNACALVMSHPGKARQHRVPAHKFLWFEWGNKEVEISQTDTIFRFSRPETQVANALRSELAARGVPHEDLRFDERTREERTRGNQVTLQWKKN